MADGGDVPGVIWSRAPVLRDDDPSPVDRRPGATQPPRSTGAGRSRRSTSRGAPVADSDGVDRGDTRPGICRFGPDEHGSRRRGLARAYDSATPPVANGRVASRRLQRREPGRDVLLPRRGADRVPSIR
ncbi:MAG: hypothetical protein R2838_05915 [Caldilineaceae bacterium]